MALIEKLNAIGDAIRAKNGAEEKYTLDGMVAAIGAIESGGGSGGSDIPDEFFKITGDCSYKFSNNNMNYLLETEPFKSGWYSEDITTCTNMFGSSTNLTEIPFTLNFGGNFIKPASGNSLGNLFNNCYKLKQLPELGTQIYPYSLSAAFSGLRSITSITDSWVENLYGDRMWNYNNPSLGSLFYGCYSLRTIPEEFLKKLYGTQNSNTTSSSIYYQLCSYCYSLDEVKGIPVYGTFTANAYFNFCVNCHRVSDIIFDTNEDGTVKTAKWKSQTIDLSSYTGYTSSTIDMTDYGFTTTDLLNSSTTKDLNDFLTKSAANPNWYSNQVYYSRYNHDSAVNTINSLPDTSAYIAANGGTNTIKFKGTSGSAYGKAIDTLTTEEIAVAAAKGWTVTLV